jgi:hypothetical protein
MHFSRCWSVLLRFRAQPTPAVAESETAPNPNGWIGTETVKIPFGNFDFKNGYPTPDAAAGLSDQLKFNRAIEVYLTQMMPVSEIALREGVRAFGAKKPMQVVVWEDLMDARCLLRTPKPSTPWATSILKTDGPTVVEAPAHMLGFFQDGQLGPDKGAGGSSSFCHRVSRESCRRDISLSAPRQVERL